MKNKLKFNKQLFKKEVTYEEYKSYSKHKHKSKSRNKESDIYEKINKDNKDSSFFTSITPNKSCLSKEITINKANKNILYYLGLKTDRFNTNNKGEVLNVKGNFKKRVDINDFYKETEKKKPNVRSISNRSSSINTNRVLLPDNDISEMKNIKNRSQFKSNLTRNVFLKGMLLNTSYTYDVNISKKKLFPHKSCSNITASFKIADESRGKSNKRYEYINFNNQKEGYAGFSSLSKRKREENPYFSNFNLEETIKKEANSRKRGLYQSSIFDFSHSNRSCFLKMKGK